jgi:hypothetical protein
MNVTGRNKLNVRPRPGPLPQERENRSPAPGIAQSPCRSPVIMPEGPTTGVNPMDPRVMRTSQLLFPLPGREGQGEGGYNN